MQDMNSSIAYIINVHERLIRDFPMTPYNIWCQRVHALRIDPKQKWEYLLSWKVIPAEYENPELFRYDWQAFKLLSKFCPGGKPSEQDIDVAYRKFRSAELRCALVNKMMRRGSLKPGIAALLHNVKNIVSSVIGDPRDMFTWVVASSKAHPDLKIIIDRFSIDYGPGQESQLDPLSPKFGPGISVGRMGSKISSYAEKIVYGTVTPQAAFFMRWLDEVWPEVFPTTPHGVRGSCLTFVPKRVGEARTICYEPSMNMVIQKLVGLYLKFQLKAKLGIDLSDQERNRSLAQLGSLTDSYCTVDLSSASDLNCIELVRQTFSQSWFHLLDSIRSPQYWDPIKKSWETFHKFSTMGNGFTFELETLIFAAIAKSAISRISSISWREIAVYGDDLLFPKEFYSEVTQALTVLGHIPNLEKSFASGPFRESCGGDFFNGWDVTPFKLKELSLNDPKTVVNLYNGLTISSREDPLLYSISDRFIRALNFVKSWLQRNYPRISEGPYEWDSYSHTLRCRRFQPSNRWLWSDRPTLNTSYSPFTQRVEPKYVLSTVLWAKNPTYYDVLPETVLYNMLSRGVERSNRTEIVRFRRNLNLFRPKVKKTGNYCMDLTPVQCSPAL